MVAPSVRAIITRHPNAEFTFFTSSDGAALFKNFDARITEFLINGKSPFTRRVKWIYFYFKLRKMDFDLVYCLDSDWRIRSLLERATHRLFKRTVIKYDHVVHAAIKALQSIGEKTVNVSDITIPFIPVDEVKIADLNNYLHSKDIKSDDILVGLNPSFSGLNRRKTRKYKLWPINKWAQLADKLHEYGKQKNKSIKVLIYILPKDRQLASDICSLCEFPPVVLIPEADLEFFKAYLSRLDLFIGPDTGGTHLAAGLGTNLIALYAITDPFDCGPVVKNIYSSVIRAKIDGDQGNYLDLISVEDVFILAKEKLAITAK